jgi:hypothetical protein
MLPRINGSWPTSIGLTMLLTTPSFRTFSPKKMPLGPSSTSMVSRVWTASCSSPACPCPWASRIALVR